MTAGRPLKYKTAEELEEAIDKYFESRVDEPIIDEEGNVLLDKTGCPCMIPHPPTVAGLALWLGFEDRRSMYDYKDRPEFSHAIKKAIEKIADYAEQHLYQGKATGAIFWLKNHGWKDKQETDVNINDYSLFAERTEEKAKFYEDQHLRRSQKGNGK